MKACERCGESFYPGKGNNWKKLCFTCYQRESEKKALAQERKCVQCGSGFKPRHAVATLCDTCYFERQNAINNKIKENVKQFTNPKP